LPEIKLWYRTITFQYPCNGLYPINQKPPNASKVDCISQSAAFFLLSQTSVPGAYILKMASRQLRKLRQQQELLSKNEIRESDESEDEPVVAQPRKNVFAGFAALGGDDDEPESEEEVEASGPRTDPLETVAAPAKKAKKPKKKKKKAKKTEVSDPAKEEDSLDEIDRVLEELNLAKQASGTSTSASTATGQLSDLLRINFQHLKAINEMRKLFGKSIDAAQAEQPTPVQRGARREVDLETFLGVPPEMLNRQGKSMFETVLRSNPFIEGKKTWPRDTAHGLKMIRVTEGGGADGVVEFAFTHDKAYDELEANFFTLVQMYDPMQLVYFLHRHPYHISSLIQVSEVAIRDQNNALAADLIERALFTFGRLSLSEFRKKLEEGKAKLDINRPENRQFFLAIYKLVQHLTLKGTYRTALEWAKLGLSVNRSDPYAMLNWIHVLAIRAREAKWFVDLCSNTEFADQKTLYIKQTVPLAMLQLKDVEGARKAVLEGMKSVPWLYGQLFSVLNLDTPKAIWGVTPRDDDDELHTKLYLHMAKDLWATPEATSLLIEAGKTASKADVSTLPPGPYVSLGTARFVYLENNPELMSAVPRNMHRPEINYQFDPIPPPEHDNIFTSPAQRLPWSSVHDQLRMGNSARRVEDNEFRRRIQNEREQALRGVRRQLPDDPQLRERLDELVREVEQEDQEGGEGVRDPRGWMRRFVDFAMPQLWQQGVPAGAEDAAEEGAGAQRDPIMDLAIWDLVTHLGNRGRGADGDEYDDDEFVPQQQMPGAWGGDEDEDEDEPPALEPLDGEDNARNSNRPVDRRARVEDADDDSDDEHGHGRGMPGQW